MAPAENFGYRDEEFFSNPLKETDGAIPADGLYLGAPAAVTLADRKQLPVVVRRASSLRDSIALSFKRFALLHAIDVQRNQAYVAYAIEQDNAVYAERSAAELDGVAPARTLQPYLLDARARLNVPWLPSELLVMVSMRDKVSNRRRVSLGPGAAAYVDPAVKEHLAKGKAGKVPPVFPRPFPEPGAPWPAYVPIDGSPPLPKAPGIEISAERVVEYRKRPSCMIRGSFLLPIGKQDLVPPEAGERHAAVVAVHFVVTGADVPAPSLQTIHVPVYGRVEVGQPAAGHFAFDLFSLFTPSPRTETYFLFFFSRDVISPPQPVAVIGRDLLPDAAPLR